MATRPGITARAVAVEKEREAKARPRARALGIDGAYSVRQRQNSPSFWMHLPSGMKKGIHCHIKE